MIVLALNFLVLLLLSSGILIFFLRDRSAGKSLERRITVIRVADHEISDRGMLELDHGVRQDRTARLGRYLERFSFAPRLRRLLLHAGSSMTIGMAVLASAGSGAVAGLLCLLVLRSPIVAALLFAIGAAAPLGLLHWKLALRIRDFNKELPAALDLMARALRAGHSMASAIELVGEQSPPPLGPEFTNVFQQQKFGLRFREALLEMGDRVPSNDLHFLITAILVQRETGGDITEILDRTTYVIRERARIQGEVRTRTAQGKLTGWILGLLPIVMLVLINLISPGYTSILFHDPVGQKMLYAGAAMIILGGLSIRKIVNVKV